MTLPSDITAIHKRAFYNNDNIVSVTIGDNVTSIGSYAFVGCDLLTNITIGDNVTSIGSYAFDECNSLTSVTIGESVTSIDKWAFACVKLVEVYNKSSLNITAGSTENGYVGYYALNVYTPTSGSSKLSTDSNGYVIYTDGAEKILVNYIGSETELTLPSGITAINKYAFYSCSKLESITIGDNVTSIGNSVFAHCDSLTSVTIGDSVISIGDRAFYCCHKLTSIEISDSITSIGSTAFYFCDLLTSVYYKGTAEDWAAIALDSNNGDLTIATRYYYVEKEEDLPNDNGNYWHYVDGKPTVWTAQ